MTRETIKNPFTNKNWEINVHVIDENGDYRKEFLNLTSLNSTELGARVLSYLFEVVKCEDVTDSYCEDPEDEMENISYLLFKSFNKEENPEKLIKDEIAFLNQNKFRDPEKLFDNDYNPNYITIEELLRKVKKWVIELRKQRIEFWKNVLEIYKKNKEFYDFQYSRDKELREERMGENKEFIKKLITKHPNGINLPNGDLK